jgi:tRNA1(Val) A37 N6-methylase TrmN6
MSSQELDQWYERIFEIYDDMGSRVSPYSAICNDILISVLPGVYAPRFFTDSLWFAQEVPRIVESRSLLEIGTGTGIIAVSCALNGAPVVATDVNPAAIVNAKENAAKHRVQIDIRQGSVYEPVGFNERFEYIFWAHPFNNWPEPVTDMLLRSGFDYRYNDLTAYIAGARDHLCENGRLLLGSGNTADLETIASIARGNAFEVGILKSIKMPLAEWGSESIEYMLLELIALS